MSLHLQHENYTFHLGTGTVVAFEDAMGKDATG